MERKESPELGKLLGQKVTNIWLDRDEKTNDIVSTMLVYETHTLIIAIKNAKLIIALQEI